MGLTSQTARRGPTIATVRAIEAVLQEAAVPMSRYQIRQALGNSVSQPTLDEALEYLAGHGLVFDEGPGGRVVWTKLPPATRTRLG